MKNCIFCLSNNSIQGKILAQNEYYYFVESIDPVLTCAGMIIPHRHVSTPFELNDKEWVSLNDFLNETKGILDKFGPHGYNIGWNVGNVAGQHIDHVHLHVIGRFNDEPLAGQGIRSHLKSKENKRV